MTTTVQNRDDVNLVCLNTVNQTIFSFNYFTNVISFIFGNNTTRLRIITHLFGTPG